MCITPNKNPIFICISFISHKFTFSKTLSNPGYCTAFIQEISFVSLAFDYLCLKLFFMYLSVWRYNFECVCVCVCVCVFLFFVKHFFVVVFRATPGADVSSQARGRIRATAASVHYSHGNKGSSTLWARLRIEPASSWILMRSLTCWATKGTLNFCHFNCAMSWCGFFWVNFLILYVLPGLG